MKSNNIKSTQATLLKVVIALAAATCYLLAFNVIDAELNERSPDVIRYEAVIRNDVNSLLNGQEVCNRVKAANNQTFDCDVIEDSRKKLDMDTCMTMNSKEYCETTLPLVYNQYNSEVANYKNSILSKTYKFVFGKERVRLTKEFEWADEVIIENWNEISRLATLAKNAK